MSISGLVIIHRGDQATLARAVARHPGFTVGATTTPGRLPVVLETATRDEERERLEWLRDQPGVALVEVAYVNFAPVAETDAAADEEPSPDAG